MRGFDPRFGRAPATPEDRSSAPYTGWTRRHWEEIFALLVDGLPAVASPGRARLVFPGQRSHHGRLADEMEGFTRTFIMAAPWLRQAASPVLKTAAQELDLAAFYRQGLLNGTDPASPEYWGDVTDYAQHLVELSSLAWGLWQSRRHIWDALSRAERDRVAAYLGQCLGKKYHPNNWQLFSVMVNTFLKVEGYPYNAAELQTYLDNADDYYLGEGWYKDGGHTQLDFYTAWTFHYYLPIWCLMDGASDPERAARIKERLGAFIGNYQYLFSSDGSFPCFGRSMTYRFAALVPFIFGALLDCSPISPGRARRICSACLKWFVGHGAINYRNHLTLGFTLPNESLLEHYSCGGSPYWAAKAFNAFMLPPEHPFWTAVEEPAEIDLGSYCRPVPSAGFLIDGDRETGHIQLINQKSFHANAEYSKKYTNFAYSNIFSYESRRVYQNTNCDNSLVWSEDRIGFSQRWRLEHRGCGPGFNAASYLLFQDDERSKGFTIVVVKDGLLINIHRLQTPRRLVFYEGGYPLGFYDGWPVLSSGPDWEMAAIDGRLSFIRRLWGYDAQVPAHAFNDDCNGTNVRFPKSVVPGVGRLSQAPGDFILASLVCGRTGLKPGADLAATVRDFQVPAPGVALLSFADGEKVLVRLGETDPAAVALNGREIPGGVMFARAGPDGRDLTGRGVSPQSSS